LGWPLFGILPASVFGVRVGVSLLLPRLPLLLLKTVGGCGAEPAAFGVRSGLPPLLPLLLSKTVGGRGTERPFVVSATFGRPFPGPPMFSLLRCWPRPAGFPGAPCGPLFLPLSFLPLLNGEAGAEGGVMFLTGWRANARCGGTAAARPAFAPSTLVRLGSNPAPPTT
jgi:hypothetical protein